MIVSVSPLIFTPKRDNLGLSTTDLVVLVYRSYSSARLDLRGFSSSTNYARTITLQPTPDEDGILKDITEYILTIEEGPYNGERLERRKCHQGYQVIIYVSSRRCGLPKFRAFSSNLSRMGINGLRLPIGHGEICYNI